MHAELKTEPGFHYLYDKAEAPQAPDIPPAISDIQAGRLRTRGVEPWHQKHWDWKASGNFLCGGAGAGLFTFAAFVGLNGAPIVWPALIGLALVAAGLGLLLFKIGRPLRFLYVFRQPKRSWMSREAWVVAFWFPFALFALWSNYAPFLLPVAIVALFFIFCQGMILEQAKGIPAWRTPRVIAFIMATALAEGCGLLLVFAAFLPSLAPVAKPMAITLAVLTAVRLWTWWRYLNALETEGAPTRTLEVFGACQVWFFVLGLAAPVALVAAGLLLADAAAILFALAGLCAFAAGWALKFILITRAAYNQGFALRHTPVRGAGVPGPAVKPGWTTHEKFGSKG
jgi:phenylacetyl-CoA:acceptor oxidoreductase subunit 2